jgi:hypothetical protein
VVFLICWIFCVIRDLGFPPPSVSAEHTAIFASKSLARTLLKDCSLKLDKKSSAKFKIKIKIKIRTSTLNAQRSTLNAQLTPLTIPSPRWRRRGHSPRWVSLHGASSTNQSWWRILVTMGVHSLILQIHFSFLQLARTRRSQDR